MQYRTFGRTDFKPSALGFGCMRLPRTNGGIDEEEAIRMIRYAIDHGVNYIDTAYFYHKGQSELLVGKALQDGYRERVKLASKMPPWKCETADDLDRIFDEQLRKLQSERIDCYMLHGMSKDTWEQMLGYKALEWAERKRAEGQIEFFGFSFHDSVDVFKSIVDGHDRWDFCQIQYNYMDVENQAGTEGLRYAAGKGLAVIVMEPLLGGRLAGTPPEPVQAIWGRSPNGHSPAARALHWIWNQPEVSLLLSGMSTMEQVVENVETAKASQVRSLSAEQDALFDEARQAYLDLRPVPCTRCDYCQPCPEEVKIPRILGIYNDAMEWDDIAGAKRAYNRLREEHGGQKCVECGQCEEKCPQKIPITEWLKKIDGALADA